MLNSDTIWIVLLTCIPIFLYSYLVYFLIPPGFVSIKRARRYFITGLMSPMLVLLFHFIFPQWKDEQSINAITSVFIFAFLQVAVLEEITKYIVVWWINQERYSEKYDLPIAIMFYSMMVSLGFAITENVVYLISTQRELLYQQMLFGFDMQINHELFELIKNRSLTAVVAHMICGVIMGNFLSQAHKIKHTSPKNKIGKYFYIIIAIIFAALFHGIYNYNLMIPNNNYTNQFLYTILIFGLIIGWGIINKLILESISIVTEKKKRNLENETKK